MTFAVRILPVDSVTDVPKSDRLSLCQVRGYTCVTAKDEHGRHVFAPGDRIIYVPEGSVLTDQQLQDHGFWGEHPQTGRLQGKLSGPDGNVVKPVTLRGQMSVGLIWTLPAEFAHLPNNTDIAHTLGITRYIPAVPHELLDIAMPLIEAKTSYDIARLRMYPDFLANDEIVITEKLEGECCQMTWMGGDVVEGLFGDGRVAVTTKGLGEKGLVLIDNGRTHSIAIIQAILAEDLISKFLNMVATLSPAPGEKIRLFSEAVGPGVKKLHYGYEMPRVRSFDIRIDDQWLDEEPKNNLLRVSSIERVPVLYRGPWDAAIVEHHRQGNSTIGGKHTREGIVVTAIGSQNKRRAELGDEMRPILKAHSDLFLRKFDHKDD